MPGKKNNAPLPSADEVRGILPMTKATLKEKVRDALFEIVMDKTAPATARASAGRSLLLEAGDDDRPSSAAPAEQASIPELDAEIARLRVGKG